MKSWWLDELAHAGDEHLDAGYVAGYDRKVGFDPSEDLEVLRAHGLNADSIVVDLGAGTGMFAVAVAEQCRQVIAVDVSPVMVTAIRARVDTLGLDNVTVIRAGFLSYEHRGDPADIVFTRNALHQIPDFWKAVALDRIATILAPDGILCLRDLVFDFDPAEADDRIGSWLTGGVTDPSMGWTSRELADHVRGEHSTYSWLLEAMLDRTSFEIIDKTFRRSVYGAYTCRRLAS